VKSAALPPIEADESAYRIAGRPFHLCSGEFHYFRVPPRDWRRRMRLFKAAGGNCLATYIPWLLHEPEEGCFRFGEAGGSYDLERFLATAAEESLYVIARPGPYQYSELIYDGLPVWLCENYPDLRARNLEGKPFRTASISYLHPLFLEKARRWFAEVCPRIARFSVTRGGPVAFAQFDNELAGIHMWFGSLDYHPDTVGFGHPAGRYPRFLADRYGDVARLNAAYETAFASFADVRPLAPRSTGHPPEVRRLRDYLHFYLDMLAEYAETLACLMRENGLDVPLVHNSAGPAMNAYFRPLRAIRHEPALRAHGSGGRMPPVVEPETDRYGPASSAGHDGQGGGVETVVGGAPLCHARPVIP
jgi:beta-galactosidase